MNGSLDPDKKKEPVAPIHKSRDACGKPKKTDDFFQSLGLSSRHKFHGAIKNSSIGQAPSTFLKRASTFYLARPGDRKGARSLPDVT